MNCSHCASLMPAGSLLCAACGAPKTTDSIARVRSSSIARWLIAAMLVFLSLGLLLQPQSAPPALGVVRSDNKPMSQPGPTSVPIALVSVPPIEPPPSVQAMYLINGIYVRPDAVTDDPTNNLGPLFESRLNKELERRGTKVDAAPSSERWFTLQGRIKQARMRSEGGEHYLDVTLVLRVSRGFMGSVAFLEQQGSLKLPDPSLETLHESAEPIIEALTEALVSGLISAAPNIRGQ